MTSRDLRRRLRQAGCVEVRQRGSHLIVRCGKCQGVVPIHQRDVSVGTLHAIKKSLEPCLGKGWLT